MRQPPRLASLLVVASAITCGAPRTPTTQQRPRPSSPLAVVPFDPQFGWLVVEATVNGTGPYRFVLDTGMAGGLLPLNDELIDKITTDHTVEIGVRDASHPTFAEVTIGMADFDNKSRVHRAPPNVGCFRETTAALGIDGIIGTDLLYDYVVAIDYERNILSFYDKVGFVPTDAGPELPLRTRGGRAYVEVVLEFDTGAVLSRDLVLDTGTPIALSLAVGPAEDVPLPISAIPASYQTTGGPRDEHVGRVRAIQWAGHRIANVVAHFRERRLGHHAAGLLGSGLLKRFSVVLDYSRGRLFLTPNSGFDEPFEYDMLGLKFQACALDQRLLVKTVLPGSPAAEAGIKSDDELVAVNGVPADTSRLDEYYRRFRGRVGDEILLRFVRDGAEYEVTVRLRRLV